MTEAFLAMRAGLIEHGLLTPDFRLTEAGNAHVEQLKDALREAEAPREPWRPRVRWNVDLARRASA